MVPDLPPELLYAIFYILDDSSRRNFAATCIGLRHAWVAKAWQRLTFSGRHVKAQLNRFVSWTHDDLAEAANRTKHTRELHIRACLLGSDAAPESEGHHNTDILDGDIFPLLDYLADTLRILSIDLPPTHSSHFFDDSLNSISRLVHLERLFLGRVKVDDGYDVVCKYSGLKEATMVWCHGIVEQRLLADQLQLEYIDVHDSWDIGNLREISHEWCNLKSFRFSAIDSNYAISILENGSGLMRSLEDVSIEVPMSEPVFFRIIGYLSHCPIKRFHISLSAVGLGLFVDRPSGRNEVPSEFGPEWLRLISTSLPQLEELVLDYRSGGISRDLVWPGEHVAYASALSSAKQLRTLAVSIHAIPQTERSSCRDIAHGYMEHIPNLQEMHFPAMPIFPAHQFHSSSMRRHQSDFGCIGYSLFRRSGELYESPSDGDCYRPFWITHGIDVVVDRHRRVGGLPIVTGEDDDSLAPELFVDPEIVDIFDEDVPDPAPLLQNNENAGLDADHADLQYPLEPPDDWVELISGMANVGIAQLEPLVLGEHGSGGGIFDDDSDDFELDEVVPF